MSLQSRIADLITAIGSDIKALQTRLGTYSASTAQQTIAGSDQYLAGSAIAIPHGKIKAGTIYRCKFNVVKTAASVSTPVVNVRVGAAGSTADTARVVLTFAAQTAVADEGEFEFECVFRASGAAAVIQAKGSLLHRLVTTGLNNTAVQTVVLGTSASFDVTGADLKIGLSVNPGPSASWVVNVVTAELINLAA